MSELPPSKDSRLEHLGAVLGPQYTVERELGRGGMGIVILARDNTLDRLVAIKIIGGDQGADPGVRARFLQEARAVARLRHPNIVSVHTAGESAGLAWFAMEYVPGESLRDLLNRESRVTGARAQRILREIALALDYAHSQGLIHRDIKPENILLDAESGRAMLTDFGVARAFEKDGGLTQTGMILGSPRYMSPEQAAGDRALDGRADLYALALVGYELYTGTPVVQSGTVASMLVRHLTETPAPLSEKVSDVPLHVAAAIDRGLAKDPDHRWQTGRQFEDALSGESHAHPPSEVRRKPAAIRTAAIVAAAAAVAAAGALFSIRAPGDPDTAYLVAPFEVQTGDPSARWLREGSVNMLTLTLGQWADLNVINYERTLSLLDDAGLAEKARLTLDDARELARSAHAGTVVTGQIQTTRDSLIVTARLFDVASGDPKESAQESSAIGDDPRPLFDRLAQRLLAIAGGPASGMQLSQATTTSLEAYRAYLEGVRMLNDWKLAEADSAFVRAIALDSTFALAYHKRSLGLGWSQVGGELYTSAAARAFALAQRLPPRERALVEGHHHVAQGLSAGLSAVSGTSAAQQSFNLAITTYRRLLAHDSLVAEAWYGLADSYFHARLPGVPLDSILAYTTHSLRGFHRALAVDSANRLAYSHLVQLYNQASAPSSGLGFIEDSAVDLSRQDEATVGASRAAAQGRGIEIARAWVRADNGSLQSTLQLAQSFDAAGQRDSAFRTLREALPRIRNGSPTIRLNLLAMQVQAGDTAIRETLRYVLDHYTADSLRTIAVGQRFNSTGFMVAAAAVIGSSEAMERAAALFVESDPTLPFSRVATAPYMDLSRRILRLAMGEESTPETHRSLLSAVRNIDTMPAPVGPQVREGSSSIPLLAFLATRDTTFLDYLRRWTRSPWADLDAVVALDRGDTATAMRIASTFPRPDSLRNPAVRFGSGGLRALARADVLARLGLTRQAAENYEVIDPYRVNRAGLAEPGYAALVRSLLHQARLWRQAGERDKAIRAYENFIQRWSEADGVAARQVAEARQELAALRDSPQPRTP